MATDVNVNIATIKQSQINCQLNRLSSIEAQLRDRIQELSTKLTPVLGLPTVRDAGEDAYKPNDSLVPLAVELNKYLNGLQDNLDILQSIMDRIEL